MVILFVVLILLRICFFKVVCFCILICSLIGIRVGLILSRFLLIDLFCLFIIIIGMGWDRCLFIKMFIFIFLIFLMGGIFFKLIRCMGKGFLWC